MIDASTKYALESINWSFPGNIARSRSIHGLFDARKLHWYPATYIPEIPYSLVEILSRPGDRVLDPFAGIGTTLWQALSLEREAFGAELNLVAQAICADIWTLLSVDTDLDEAQDQVLGLLRQWDGTDLTGAFKSSIAGPLLEPWFSPGTFLELAFLWSLEDMLRGTPAGNLLRISTSAILASVSEQKDGWGCIADNMKPRAKDFADAPTTRAPIEKVGHRVRAIVRSVAAAREKLTSGSGYKPHASDALTHLYMGDSVDSGAMAHDSFYDLLVTSPPYPEMVDYATAHRLSYYWQGVLPERDVPKEIGARRRRFSSRSLRDYTVEMERSLAAMAGTVKPGGVLAMVVPAFSTSTADDPRSLALEGALASAVSSGLELKWQTDRILPTNRRHLNQKWTSLKRENIRVYERIE